LENDRDNLVEKLRKSPLGTVIDKMKACTKCHAQGNINGEVCSCCEGEMIFPRHQLFRRELCDLSDPQEAAIVSEIANSALKF